MMAKRQFDFDFLLGIVAQFLGTEEVASIERYGKGSINDSFRVVTAGRSYLLQRVNGEYFPEPLKLLSNFRKIASCQKGLPGLMAFELKDGSSLWYRDDSGAYWRLYNFFEHSYGCQRIGNVYQAYEIAKAYGQYLAALSDLPLGSLDVVVSGFHDTVRRYRQLLAAVERDEFRRVADCRQEIDFVKSKLEEIVNFSWLVDGETLPWRLTHNDTGIDNVLLDKNTGAALAVIDWDTTMPGFSLWDFGDLFRSALGTEFGDQVSTTQCFNALLKGYLAGAGHLLLPEEVANFARAGKIISLELGIRYLTDFLSGDIVFKYDDGISLLRARKSLLRYKMMALHEAELDRIADGALSACVC
jgi:aminoglycoside phosphotransferase (APT) family kinase protein